MSGALVVVDSPKRWPLRIPGAEVVSSREYLTDPSCASSPGTRFTRSPGSRSTAAPGTTGKPPSKISCVGGRSCACSSCASSAAWRAAASSATCPTRGARSTPVAGCAPARRRGVAGSLYRDFFHFASTRTGLVTCEVNTRPPNPESMSFHQSFGFRQVGTQETDGGAKTVSLMGVDLKARG